ncbi:hypothetical protein [Actinomadura parmotrematis]|uniref:Uncharacterized protein n=1 Tax=Actinomadura parmotrematis TaxID=2864039 RepID=A0ABS7FTB7_9ACTN|nr:hypothetical protein [Actinomadura parmotrematis]MBW8483536.1 hypothetical protein [Actinomadura parmotrematis]
MSGDQGSEGPARAARPRFLPPEQDPAEPAADVPAADVPAAGATADVPAAGATTGAVPPPGGASAWALATVAAAAALLVSAFLPWAHATFGVSIFGQVLPERTVTAAGIEADGTVLVVPVLAVTAIVLAVWGLLGRDRWIALLTAVPGALALVACLVFLVRLERGAEEMAGRDEVFGAQTEVALDYGWYLAVAASLLVLGLGLARPVVARVARRSPDVPGAPAADQS